jgi:hypothetical protein
MTEPSTWPFVSLLWVERRCYPLVPYAILQPFREAARRIRVDRGATYGCAGS